jgi:AbrB family looped-hinge helix DNA binding protein
MKNVATSTITSKSQTVIPRPVREKLGLRPGDRLRYVETAEGIVIEKARIPEDDRGRVKTRLQIAYDGRCFERGSDEAAGGRGRDQAAIAVISGLTPKMLIMRFML